MVREFAEADSISEIASPVFLATLVGEIRSLEREPMTTVGFSGTQFERLHLELASGEPTTFVLKHIHPERDATAWRSGGIAAREARLLGERALDRVWEVFDAPYLAYAFEGEASAVLMRDLSEHLFPDAREPITAEHEDALIDHLARLHAAFWESEARQLPWLAKAEFVYGFLAPSEIEMEEARGRRHPVFTAAREGWEVAHRMLPTVVSRLLSTPPIELAQTAVGLSRTILHGDAKVANFAMLPDGRVSAFDWATICEGCPTIEIGWYVSVNATRLTRSKEEIFGVYRTALERHLGRELSNAMWQRMYDAAILGGAMVLLWNKALNVKKGVPDAAAEWKWWVGELERLSAAR